MPTQTFLNLPAEKRARFNELALEEFAEHGFGGASVSRLVGRAGIAKGSVYQYFANKQELYLFLVEQAQRVLLDHVRSLASFGDPSQVDFLQALRTQMSATVQAALAHPREARLVQRAYLSPAPIRDALERQGIRVRNAHMQALLSAAQARGELAPDLDPEIVAHILAAVAGGLGPLAMQRLGLDSEGETPIPAEKLDPAVLEPVFDGVLRLLRFGLDPRSRPGSHAEVQ